jgi:predicted RND superfamily exporter protein
LNYTRVLNFAINRPKVIYLIVALLSLLSIAMIPNIQIDTDPENMLSQDAPARVFHNKIKKDFLMRDMIVVGIVSKNSIFTTQALNIINTLTEQTLEIDGVIRQDLLSLSVVDNITQLVDEQGNNNGILFKYLMKEAPTSLEASEYIQQAVKRLPMLNNTLVSGDDRAIAIYVPITEKDISYKVAEQIRAISQTFDTELEFHITGLPVAEDQFGYEMFVQMGVAAPLAGLAIFVLLWYFFRNIPLIVAPMIVAMATVIIIMGSLIGLGFTVHIMSSMIAIFLMPIAVVDSVHILSEFADRYKKGDNPSAVVKQVMSHLYTPMLFTSITSAVGFFSLMLTPIPPVKVFGAFIGCGILLAFALTITFIPAYIARLSPSTLEKLQQALQRLEQKGRLAAILEKLGVFAMKKTKLILIAFIALFVLSVEGITRIEINDNPVNWFKADHEIRIADQVLNQHFAGTYDAWLVFENDASISNEAVMAFEQLLTEAPNTKALKNSLLTKITRLQYESATNQSSFFNEELLITIDDYRFEASDNEQAWLNLLYEFCDDIINAQQVMIQPTMQNWLVDLQTALVASGNVGKVNG